MKNNIDFYQHYANADQHPKFKMLRVQFGWSGEGKFWALNNRIAQSENCCLDISKKYNKASIANDLDFNIQEFDLFIEFLKDDCELIDECEPGIITTDIIQENFDKVSEKRKKNQSYYKKVVSDTFSNSQLTEKEIQQAENIQSKVKESKVNKTKVKTTFKKYIQEKIIQHNFIETKDKIFEFYLYRMSMPAQNRYKTEKGINGLFRDLNGCRKAGLIVSECLEEAMEREWKTPNPSYFKNNKQPGFQTRADKNKEEGLKFING